MKITPMIRKASGEVQPFIPAKLKESLRRSGAKSTITEEIIKEIDQWISLEVEKTKSAIPSKTIYKKAFSLLRSRTISNAARYKLKNAMMEMGPTGYPFEYFAGEIYKVLGYSTEVGKTLQGECITHEVDVVASKGKHQRFIECKYYSSTGKNANVQVPLYIHSRVNDIIAKRSKSPEFKDYTFSGGIVTNTRFTSDAETFGNCAGLHLLSWDYPAGNSIKDIIDREKIFPVTSLTTITKAQKAILMQQGIVICRQLLENREALDELKLTSRKLKKVLEELRDLCG